jgi:acetyl-CoA synthetase
VSEEQQNGQGSGVETYSPPEDFAKNANIQDPEIWQKANEDRESFWESWARELHWFKEWDQVCNWDPPFVQWFVGGKINAAYNCLDRHIEDGKGDKTAFIWQGDEPDHQQSYTYDELLTEVNKFANVLKDFGVQKGDPVSIYLPMIPELLISMLACARIGATHSVIFSAFAPAQVAERVNDIQSKIFITADESPRGGQKTPLKENTDEAMQEVESVENVIVVRRTGEDVPMTEGRDHYWEELAQDASDECEAEEMDSEDTFFILYSSGSTGKPKGIIHTHGGYLTQLYATMMWVLDHKEEDVFWCTADVGWITGHSYLVYGPLVVGGTTLMFEGTPTYPENNRWFQVIEEHGVTVLYAAPTAIRAFQQAGPEEAIGDADISSLRLLGSVGEPINPDAWRWYYENIGRSQCPIVDTWWQTETGTIMSSNLPGINDMVPGSTTYPFPGIEFALYDSEEQDWVECPGSGELVIPKPWPSQLRNLTDGEDRYIDEYFSEIDESNYYVEDGASCDETGSYTITGRIDDVLNVSGHRLSTIEIENALQGAEGVAEAAVIGRSHDTKGEEPVGFVILEQGTEYSEDFMSELRDHVGDEAGDVAKPGQVFAVSELPKTNSGKIMRRILENIAEGEELGDTSTLADPSVAETIQEETQEQMQ